MKKVIVITGGGSGMGLATIKELGKEYAIVITGRTLSKLEKASEEYTKEGYEIYPYACDVSKKEEVKELAKFSKEKGEIVALIHAAGVSPHMGDAETIIKINALGTHYVDQAFKEVMNEGSVILNVSSMAAYSAITRVPGYSAAKTAVSNFTQWLAMDLALKYGDGIRVNAIAPGFFIGDQNRAVLINPDGSLTDRSKKVLAKTPMKRFGDITELNGTVQFLCSDAASFITGAIIPVDGGFSAFSGV